MPPTSKRARPQRTWNAPRTILACALDTYADTNRALRSVGIGPKQLLSNRDSPPEWVQKPPQVSAFVQPDCMRPAG